MMPLYASSEDMIGEEKKRQAKEDEYEDGEEEEEEEEGEGEGEGGGEGGQGRRHTKRKSTGEDTAALSLYCNAPKVPTSNLKYTIT